MTITLFLALYVVGFFIVGGIVARHVYDDGPAATFGSVVIDSDADGGDRKAAIIDGVFFGLINPLAILLVILVHIGMAVSWLWLHIFLGTRR